MKVSRRTLIGGGIVGAVTAGVVGFFGGWFDTYESDVLVKNRRATSATVDLELTNLDADQTVLDESFTLAPNEHFRREGVFSDDSQYRVTVQIGGNSTKKKFETCCQGFQVSIYVERDQTQVLLGHYD